MTAPYTVGLREPIANVMVGAVEDVIVHRNAHDPIEDLVTAGLLGLMRLVGAVGEEVCRTIERASVHQPSRSYWKICGECGDASPSGTHRVCLDNVREQIARDEAAR